MAQHEKINYIEFPSDDLQATKAFFNAAFDWEFEDFGPDYSAFANAGLDGGIYRAPLHSDTGNGAALVVLYSNDLKASQEKVIKAGGKIVKDIFAFPGGQRFHFCEPRGSEFAVWALAFE